MTKWIAESKYEGIQNAPIWGQNPERDSFWAEWQLGNLAERAWHMCLTPLLLVGSYWTNGSQPYKWLAEPILSCLQDVSESDSDSRKKYLVPERCWDWPTDVRRRNHRSPWVKTKLLLIYSWYSKIFFSLLHRIQMLDTRLWGMTLLSSFLQGGNLYFERASFCKCHRLWGSWVKSLMLLNKVR
jgi:hypothetical protein